MDETLLYLIWKIKKNEWKFLIGRIENIIFVVCDRVLSMLFEFDLLDAGHSRERILVCINYV